MGRVSPNGANAAKRCCGTSDLIQAPFGPRRFSPALCLSEEYP